MTHTPGPWKREYDAEADIVSGERDSGCTIATVWPDNSEYEANANLIAAAPDLLEAIETVISYNRDIRDGKLNYRPQDHIDVLEAAIAKAKGPTP